MLSGTNKNYIKKHIPHISKLLAYDPYEVAKFSEVLIIATKESEFNAILANINNKVIIDFVGLSKRIGKKENYIGLNW